jgi:hypothetical protein
MPQVFAVVFAGIGVYAGVKWLSDKIERKLAEAAQVMAEMEERERKAATSKRTKDLGTLVYDPVSRVYKPGNARGA